MIVESILAPEWVSTLFGKLTSLLDNRQRELDKLAEVLGGDPKQLAQFYIEPYCQNLSPSDREEDEPWAVFRQPIRTWLNGWFSTSNRGFREDDGRNTLFILADAGMGKTALLAMLQLTYITDFWPRSTKLKLLKLGESSLIDIIEIRERTSTILLLDALDEDPLAWANFEGRIKSLLNAVRGFHRVIISCRTQFFPENSGPIERTRDEGVVVAGFRCRMLYLSLFDDRQVQEYLKRVFPRSEAKMQRAHAVIRKMSSLRMRPMLLSRIQDLMELEVEGNWSSYRIYLELIDQWLRREEAKPHSVAPASVLWSTCRALAVYLHINNLQKISLEELQKVLGGEAAYISALDFTSRSLLNRVGEASTFRFAHRSIQEFLVVNYLITEPSASESRLDITDEMARFLGDWISEDIKNRISMTIRLRVVAGELYMPDGWLSAQADLSGKYLQNACLVKVNLAYANLSSANLRGADLSDAILYGANLNDADLSEAILRGTDLRNALLSGAKITKEQLLSARKDL
jgi:uncharacterized protein YjbI with pentapeptide repeats